MKSSIPISFTKKKNAKKKKKKKKLKVVGLELTLTDRQIVCLANYYNYHQFLFVVFCLISSHELATMKV